MAEQEEVRPPTSFFDDDTNKSSPIKTPPANDKASTNINTSSRQKHTQGSLALDIFPSNRSDDSENNDPPFKTPRAVVWTVLVLSTVACLMYLVGQLTPMWGLGASIQITFTEDSNRAPVSKSYEPYQMSLFFSIKCCLETGLVAEVILGVILFFFSGVWPHVKLGLMLYAWFARINHRFRTIILYWVDSIGKFSFSDPLIVVGLMTAFTVGVNVSPDDLFFETIANIVLKSQLLDDSITVDDVELIVLKLDIVAFYGIYCFCLAVWLSLMLGAVVQHYNVRLQLLITADDVLSEDSCNRMTETSVENGNGSNDDGKNKQLDSDDVAGMFRKKTKWISGLVTFPIRLFLILSIILPIFERTIDGVLPMLMSAFGYITVPDPPSIIQESMTFGNILSFLAQQEGNAIYIMIATVAFFCLAAPIFRSIVLDLMWYLPTPISPASNNNDITTKALYRRKADAILSASSISSIFDALAVWLFAIVLVHLEIGAISTQIDMPFCNEVAMGAQMLDSICPEIGGIGGEDAFWKSSEYQKAWDVFSRKHEGVFPNNTLSYNDAGINSTLSFDGVECSYIASIAEAFDLSQCLDIKINFLLGMWFVTVAVFLAYASSLLLTYPWSVVIYGQDNFEAPVCYRPGGWFCCCCCVGETRDSLEDQDHLNANKPTGNCDSNSDLQRFKYSFSQSNTGCCWCCHKKHTN